MGRPNSAVARNRSHSVADMYDFTVLRELRKREGLNIADVSARASISPAVISKLERNQTRAELETLFRLSRVFGMNATDLLALAESRTAHKTKASRHNAGGFRFQEIRYGNARGLFGAGTAGQKVSRPEIHQDDYEICWILQGRVRFSLPNETHELQAGEAIQFDAILSHTYEVLENCQMVIIQLRKGKRF